MKHPQFTIDEITAVLRRRKKVLLIPFIIISLACITCAFVLPKKYESYTTILVQRDQVLNPLISYTMAVETASDDRLRDLNEIIFSSPTIEALMDSLGLQYSVKTGNDKDKLIKAIMKNIKTELRGSDSYTIHYYDPSPKKAQMAAKVLSELFIKTRLTVNNKRNELAVAFFENKLDELRNKFEQSQQQFISVIKQQMDQMPVGDRVVYSNIDEVNGQIGNLESKSKDYQKALSILQNYFGNNNQPGSIKILYDLPLLNIPFAEDLKSLLNKYDDLSQKYTTMFPDIQSLISQISGIAIRIRHAIESELSNLQTQILKNESERNQAISTIKSATVSQNENQDVKSTYDIYQKLYDDMKIKLEQARTTRDLGEKGADQFVVIDPPQLPTSPAKPNKLLLIGGGIFLGLFIGFISAGLTELFDTRIRTDKDIENYDKPIIAFLPAPSFKND